MKRILAGVLVALISVNTFSATTVPVQLLNPTGSSSGQAIVSTGASSAPAWGNVNASTLNGATFASPGSIGSTTPGSGAFTTLSASSTVSGAGFSTYLASPPAIGGTAAAAGAFTTLSATGLMTPSTTNGIKGTTAADNANAGSVGEYISSSISSGSAVSLTTLTPANVTSITLTAGDWEVSGTIGFTPSSTPTIVAGCVNSTSATICSPAAGALFYLPYTSNTAGAQITSPTGARRFNVSTNTTVYLVAQCNFSGTCSAFGLLQAWRRR